MKENRNPQHRISMEIIVDRYGKEKKSRCSAWRQTMIAAIGKKVGGGVFLICWLLSRRTWTFTPQLVGQQM